MQWRRQQEAQHMDMPPLPMPHEVRVTNPKTGGQKGQKLARYDLVPVEPLRKVAELYGRGAAKYEDRNWERGYDWSLSYAALQRHANQFWGGESVDQETGCHHLASVIFHAMAMIEYEQTHRELDDRPHTVQHTVPDPSSTSGHDHGNPGGGDYVGPRDSFTPTAKNAQRHLDNPGDGMWARWRDGLSWNWSRDGGDR